MSRKPKHAPAETAKDDQLAEFARLALELAVLSPTRFNAVLEEMTKEAANERTERAA